jgi:hypothetical protein
MATVTVRRGPGVVPIDVAQAALRVGMGSAQREVGGSVVERGAGKAGRFVTVRAVVAEFAPVHVVVAVAVDTAGRRLPMKLARGMALAAGEGLVSSFEREIRARVVEQLRRQSDDVGVPPPVVAVALPALRQRAAVEPTVEAFVFGDVGAHVLVALDASLALETPVDRTMAVAAVALEIGMTGHERPRHQQLLEVRGAARRRAGEDEQQREGSEREDSHGQ